MPLAGAGLVAQTGRGQVEHRTRASWQALRVAIGFVAVVSVSLVIGFVVRADVEQWIAPSSLARGIGMDARDGGRRAG